jgi:excisionase family DNA binding protein
MSTEKALQGGLLTVQQFAEATGQKPGTVRQKVWRRQIEYVKIGRSVRFKPETVEKIVARGTVPALEEQ